MNINTEKMLEKRRQANKKTTQYQQQIAENDKAIADGMSEIIGLKEKLTSAQNQQDKRMLEQNRLLDRKAKYQAEARDAAVLAIIDTMAELCRATPDINGLLTDLRGKWTLDLILRTPSATANCAVGFITAFAQEVCADGWLEGHPPEDNQDRLVIEIGPSQDGTPGVSLSFEPMLPANVDAFMNWAKVQMERFAENRAEIYLRNVADDEPYRRALYEKLRVVYETRPGKPKQSD